jgi:hypothetical protein
MRRLGGSISPRHSTIPPPKSPYRFNFLVIIIFAHDRPLTTISQHQSYHLSSTTFATSISSNCQITVSISSALPSNILLSLFNLALSLSPLYILIHTVALYPSLPPYPFVIHHRFPKTTTTMDGLRLITNYLLFLSPPTCHSFAASRSGAH